MTTGVTLDSVKTFAEYTHLKKDSVYELTRAKGFPTIQLKKRGKIMIEREPAIEWMKQRSAQR